MTFIDFIRITMCMLFQKSILLDVRLDMSKDEEKDSYKKYSSSSEYYKNVHFEIPKIHCNNGFEFIVNMCYNENEPLTTENNHELGYYFFNVRLEEYNQENEHLKKYPRIMPILVFNQMIEEQGGIDWEKTCSPFNLENLLLLKTK